MATPTPTPRTVQPPPELPNDPKTSDVLSNYLRSFSLWCRHGFADKLSQTAAAPALMMQTDDVPPAVYQLKVTSGPTLALAPMSLGSGDVGDPVPVGQGEFLPLDGGVVSGDLNVDGHLSVANGVTTSGWNTFYQAPAYIGQAGGGSFMIQAADDGASWAMITFHEPGQFATNFGMDGGGNFHMGGWSHGANVYQFWTSRDFAHPMAAIEELQARVEALTARVEQLEAR